MNMYCPACGKENIEESYYCGSCGAQLTNTQKVEEQAQIAKLTHKTIARLPEVKRRLLTTKIALLLLGISIVALVYYSLLYRPFPYYGTGLLGGIGTILVIVATLYIILAYNSSKTTRITFFSLNPIALYLMLCLIVVLVAFIGWGAGTFSALTWGFFARPKAWIIEQLDNVPFAGSLLETNFFTKYYATIPDVLNSEACQAFYLWLIVAAAVIIAFVILYWVIKRKIIAKYVNEYSQ